MPLAVILDFPLFEIDELFLNYNETLGLLFNHDLGSFIIFVISIICHIIHFHIFHGNVFSSIGRWWAIEKIL